MHNLMPAPLSQMWVQSKIHQFETRQAWADNVRTHFVPLELDILSNNGFCNLVATQNFGNLHVSEIIASAQRVRRTDQLARQSEQAQFKLNIQLSGRTQIAQNGKIAVLNPGDWGLYDTSLPYEVSGEDNAHFLVLQFLVPALATWESKMRMCVGNRYGAENGGARVAVDSLRSLLGQSKNIDPILAEDISSNILQMFALSLGLNNVQTGKDIAVSNIDTVRQSQLQVILRYIHDNLQNTELTATSLAAQFKVSRRYLYKLFAIRDLSPADYIQTARLERCRTLLADPLFTKQISELAHLHGFTDVSTFSHAFRRRFGMSPSDWRVQAYESKENITP